MILSLRKSNFKRKFNSNILFANYLSPLNTLLTKIQVPQAAKQISAVWKAMSPEERRKWQEKSDKDRVRYDIEKVIYKGKWTVPHAGKRSKKDKMAPKRPMSAFLDFSKTYRAKVIHDNPQAKNNREISKILGTMWRNASPEDKKVFVEKEERLRAEYNKTMKQWRKEKGDQIAEKIRLREAAVQDAIDHGTVDSLVKAAEVSQQTHTRTKSEVLVAELNLQRGNSQSWMWENYYPYHPTNEQNQHTYSNIYQSSAIDQHPGYNSSILCSNGYYDRENYLCAGARSNRPVQQQQQQLSHYDIRTTSSEQDSHLTYGRWAHVQTADGGRWAHCSTAAPPNNKNSTAEHQDYAAPYFDDSQSNFYNARTTSSKGGWNRHHSDWYTWDHSFA
jgi:hypothetical protein